MYQVGTNIGNVHPPLRQGEGLATVVKDDKTDDYAVKYAQLRRAAKDKDLADRTAKRTEALKKMQTATPDFFYAHQKEVGAAYDDMMAKGLAALKSGSNDPFNGTSDADIEFQKAAAKVGQMSKFSTQIRDQYKAFQQDIQAKGPDFFDPGTITQSQDYFFGKSLADHMDNPTTAPTVQQRKPLQNSIELAAGWAGKLQSGAAKGGAVDPNTAREVVRSAFRDPESGQGIMSTFSLALKGYTEEERAALEAEALQNGLSAPEMYALKTTQAFLKSPEAYSVNDALKAGDQLFTPTTTEWRGSESFSKRVDPAKSLQSANSVARGILHDDPRALQAFASLYKLKHDPSETEAEFFQEVQAALAQDLYTRAPKDKMAGQSSEGKGNKDLELSTERWLQDMKSGKREFAQEAAGVLSGMKFYGNLFVEKAETIPGSAIEWPDEIVSNLAPGERERADYLRLRLKTPVGTQISKQEVVNQMGQEMEDKIEVIEKQGESEVFINLDKLEPTDQFLRTLYQTSHKQSGVLYKGPGWTSKGKIQDLLKPASPSAPNKSKNDQAPIYQF